MAISTKTWVVGAVLEAADFNTYIRDNIADLDARIFESDTGTYTGDGELSQGITGIGFAPKYVKVWWRQTSATATYSYETTDTMVDDNASGMAFSDRGVPAGGMATYINAIISLDADGFTVDDAGGDEHPNKNTEVYNYYCTT